MPRAAYEPPKVNFHLDSKVFPLHTFLVWSILRCSYRILCQYLAWAKLGAKAYLPECLEGSGLRIHIWNCVTRTQKQNFIIRHPNNMTLCRTLWMNYPGQIHRSRLSSSWVHWSLHDTQCIKEVPGLPPRKKLHTADSTDRKIILYSFSIPTILCFSKTFYFQRLRNEVNSRYFEKKFFSPWGFESWNTTYSASIIWALTVCQLWSRLWE